jgi:chaperonin GroEL
MLGARQSGQFLGLAIQAPGIGINQTNMLMDIAALTGATFISKDAGMRFDKMNVSVGPDGKEIVTNVLDKTVLGHVDRVIATKLTTTMQGGAGSKQAILDRIQVIQGQLTDETISDYDREQLKGRIAKLTNGVSVIKVGGQTEVEMKERKERVIDAVASCQSATKYGMVPGGEIIYLNILDELDISILGEKILYEALKKPFKQLVENGGYDGGELYEKFINETDSHWDMGPPNRGIDITDGEFKDMIEAGIIDPTNVSVTALKTAVSIATALSSLGSVTVQKNQE